MRRTAWIILALLLAGLWAWSQRSAHAPPADAPGSRTADTREPLARPPEPGTSRRPGSPSTHPGYPGWLPAEALDTLALIERDGPYPHRQDGATFQNRERRLPSRPRGYYREFTVRTPGARDRGARRIISGGRPPSEFFYTADHYRTFRRFAPAQAQR